MKHWQNYNTDDIRNIVKQKVLIHISHKKSLIKKHFLIISDKLLKVSDSRDELLTSEEIRVGLFPKFIISPPDNMEKNYSVIYIGPIDGNIRTEFFYFKKEELII